MSIVYPSTLSSIRDWAIADWQASGISPALIDANLQIFGKTTEGEEGAAIDLLLYSDKLPRTQSSGNPINGYTIRQYSHVNDGGWYCATLDYRNGWESDSLWGCFKPINPRTEIKGGFEGARAKTKIIKYEHPPKAPTEAFYLKVDPDTWQKIADKYNVSVGVYTNFWQWVKEHPTIPVYLTEGAKKAASMLSHGFVAIALPGVWNGFEKDEITQKVLGLKECIKALGLKGREVIIAFDYDQKPETQLQVARASSKLARLMKGEEATVKFLLLPPGKEGEKQGVDDYLVGSGDPDFSGCQLAKSPFRPGTDDPWELSKWPAIRTSLEKLGDLSQHLGHSLADASGLFVIKAGTSSGKTTSIGGDPNLCINGEVRGWINKGRRVLVISNRTSTGRELAKRFGVAYVEDNDRDANACGMAHCIESCKPFGKAGVRITRVSPDGEPLDSEWLNDCVVILDEFDQTLAQMLGGATCKKDRGWIVSTFKGLLQDVLGRSDGLVVAMSADISDVDVEFIVDTVAPIRTITPTILINEFRRARKYSLYSYQSQAEVYFQACKILRGKPGDKCLFFSVEGRKPSSTWGTLTIERKLLEDFPGLRVLRIDAESLGTDGHPAFGCVERLNELSREYDVILCSPSISSAVSLDERDRWVAVCDISNALNSVREYRQRLDRVREGVDRHCFIKKSGAPLGNGSSHWKGVEAGKDREFKGILSVLERTDTEDLESRSCPVSKRAFSKQVARFNRDIYRYREAALQFLQSEGVEIFEGVTELEKEQIQAIQKDFKETKNEQWDEHSQARVTANPLTPEDFEELDKKSSKTREESLSCERYRISSDLGGVELTPELIKAHDEGQHRRWKLHYYFNHQDHAHFSDSADLDAIAKKPLIHTPDVRSWKLKVKALEILGVRGVLTGEPMTAQSEEIVTLTKNAKANAKDLKGLFGTAISANCSPIQTTQTLLALMGLKLTCTARRRGANGKIERIYSFLPPTDGRDQIFAKWNEALESKITNNTATDVATVLTDCATPADCATPPDTESANVLQGKDFLCCATPRDCATPGNNISIKNKGGSKSTEREFSPPLKEGDRVRLIYEGSPRTGTIAYWNPAQNAPAILLDKEGKYGTTPIVQWGQVSAVESRERDIFALWNQIFSLVDYVPMGNPLLSSLPPDNADESVLVEYLNQLEIAAF